MLNVIWTLKQDHTGIESQMSSLKGAWNMVNQEEITSRNTIVPVAVLQGDQPETTALPVLIAGEPHSAIY